MQASPVAAKKRVTKGASPVLAPVLVVQHVLYRLWKKDRREKGMGSMMRAPEVWPVPLEGVDLSGREHGPLLLYQTHRGMEVNPLEERLEMGWLALERLSTVISFPDTGEAQVDFSYTQNCGAPPRYWAQYTARIGVGQWVQIRYNGRFSPYRSFYVSDWSYEKNVINVGWTLAPSPDMFLQNEPAYRFSMISDLF